jgi:aspartyl-tRNA synthetase
MKTMTEDLRRAINQAAGLGDGDLLFLQFGAKKLVNAVLGGLRLHVAGNLELIPQDRGKDGWKFCWITDFPLFDATEDGRYVAAHHPFTSPHPDDLERLESDPGSVRARAYDLVLNGNEIAGGSIRIHRSDVQARVVRALGLTDEDAQAKFGFLLEAFKYGPPPHGGIAFGLDRIVALLAGASSIREVIAFPKTASGGDPLTGAPTPITAAQRLESGVDAAVDDEDAPGAFEPGGEVIPDERRS